jgi:hypothetical protein
VSSVARQPSVPKAMASSEESESAVIPGRGWGGEKKPADAYAGSETLSTVTRLCES